MNENEYALYVARQKIIRLEKELREAESKYRAFIDMIQKAATLKEAKKICDEAE